MDSAVKWILLGGAAYLIYEWLEGSATTAAPASTAATTTSTAGSAGTTTTTTTKSTAPNLPTTYINALNQLALANKGGWPAAAVAANTTTGSTPVLTPDEWAYYYVQLTGESVAPSAAQINAACPKNGTGCSGAMSTTAYYSASSWLGAMQSAGLSGFGRTALGTLQIYRGARDRILRAYQNQNGMAGLGYANPLGTVFRNSEVGTPVHGPRSQHVVNKNYWEGRRGSRQLPYRWVN